jgi:ligand-binding sensor domain-containing protein
VVEVKDQGVRELFRFPGRPIDMLRRGGAIWVGTDSNLLVWTPGRPPEILGPAQNVPSGGPLLVDREGSLWVGTYRGLLQLPAPDTVAWGSAEAVATNGARRLARGAEGIWVDGWGGLTLMHSREDSWQPEPIAGTTTSALCVGTGGTLWAGYHDRFFEHRDGRAFSHPRKGLDINHDCSAGSQGRVWMLGNLGLFLGGAAPVSWPVRGR